jgi:hypothetical protein
VPGIDGGTAAGAGVLGQDGLEALESVWWQRDDGSVKVKQPAENFLTGRPGSVPLAEFVDRNGFGPMRVVPRLQRSKHVIDCMEQDAPNARKGVTIALGGLNIVVDVYLRDGQGASSWAAQVGIRSVRNRDGQARIVRVCQRDVLRG